MTSTADHHPCKSFYHDDCDAAVKNMGFIPYTGLVVNYVFYSKGGISHVHTHLGQSLMTLTLDVSGLTSVSATGMLASWLNITAYLLLNYLSWMLFQ